MLMDTSIDRTKDNGIGFCYDVTNIGTLNPPPRPFFVQRYKMDNPHVFPNTFPCITKNHHPAFLPILPLLDKKSSVIIIGYKANHGSQLSWRVLHVKLFCLCLIPGFGGTVLKGSGPLQSALAQSP